MPHRVAVAVPVPLFNTFDYLAPAAGPPPQPGVRVKVPFGRRHVVGVVLGEGGRGAPPAINLKPVEAVLDEAPLLPAELLSLCRWAAAYYHHPIGEVLATALPGPLRRGSRPASRAQSAAAPDEPELRSTGAPPLTPQQAEVLRALADLPQGYSATLLEGVTGSGKTEIYLRLAEQVLVCGLQVLMLTPEIGLTPQLVERCERRFPGRVVAYHSGMTESVRARSWLAARAGRAGIVVGTRSAVFVPFARLGLIVVDEEHDPSYKQQDRLRYSARDVAVLRAQRLDVPILLGSATPSLDTVHNARAGRYRHLRLQARVQSAAPPSIGVLDVRGQRLQHGLSVALIQACARHLDDGGQVLLFLNRRGYAPVFLCHDCGWVAPCRRCDARMTLHLPRGRGRRSLRAPSPLAGEGRADGGAIGGERGRLLCHHCGFQQAAPEACPACGSAALLPVGQGTERIESVLRERFPQRRVERLDSDRLRRRGELARLLADIRAGHVHVLVGTQILAKGHDFEGLTLVGIVNADQALYGSDFRAIERMGQLITQVAGRAGRAERPGEVLLQTHEPQHPLLRRLVEGGYGALCDALLDARRDSGLPPYTHLALLRAEALTAGTALEFLACARRALPDVRGVTTYEPMPAPMERRAGYVRAQLWIQSASRTALARALAPWAPQLDALLGARRVRWSLDVDPIDLF